MTDTTLSIPQAIAIHSANSSVLVNSPSLANSSLFVDSILGLSLSASSSSFDASVEEIVTSLDQIQGTVSLTNGFLTSDLSTPFGALQGTVDLVTLATDLNDSFQSIAGTLNLANGIASGDLTVEGELFSGSFEFAQLISDFVADLVTNFSGSVSFANGEFQLDLPTPFGDVEGTIGFGSGQLVSDLDTPFGPLDFSVDFPDTAQYSFPLSSFGGEATLDLANGRIEADLFPSNPGPELVVPLNAFSGSVTFENGFVRLDNLNGLTSLDTQFNLAQEVRSGLLTLLTETTGTLAIANGQLSADVSNTLGSFTGVLNGSQIITDLIDTLPQYDGTLTFDGGSIVSNLTTPYGAVDGTFNYGSYLDDIIGFLDGLNISG